MSADDPPRRYLPLRPHNLPRIRARLNAIELDALPRWGTLTPAAMFAHLAAAFDATTSETPPVDQSTWFTRTVLRRLVFEVMTNWPPMSKAPIPAELLPPAEDAGADRAAALAALDRYLAAVQADPQRLTVHPMFGPMTLEYTLRVHAIHLHHHCRQFGV